MSQSIEKLLVAGDTVIFLLQHLEMPGIDLVASRLSNQIAKYFAWKQDPHSLATDAIQQEWN